MAVAPSFQSFVDELSKIASESAKPRSLKQFEELLRPGDVILSQKTEPKVLSDVTNLFQRIRNWNNPLSNWTHASLYIGKGKVRHSYDPVSKKEDDDTSMKVRDQPLSLFHRKAGVSLMALRPDLNSKTRRAAVARSSRMVGRDYDVGSAIRAGVFPASTKEGEEDNPPNSLICTAVASYAYPNLSMGNKSRKHWLPIDFARSDQMKHVATLEKKGMPVVLSSFFDELTKIAAEVQKPSEASRVDLALSKMGGGDYFVGKQRGISEGIRGAVGVSGRAPRRGSC